MEAFGQRVHGPRRKPKETSNPGRVVLDFCIGKGYTYRWEQVKLRDWRSKTDSDFSWSKSVSQKDP
jgi:hypothetical protein